ncbi:MAG: hypothetical protein HKL86_07705 [Acidimicrobiaceae bacterium]|nr:hypothetical protein [Acidimicrobiaceae bacterium]
MTTNSDVLEKLRQEWRFTSHGDESRRSYVALVSKHPEVALIGLTDMGDVVHTLEAKGGRSVLERAAIISALLQEAEDVHVHRALLQTMIPGIVSVCRQLRFGEGIVDDPSETLGTALGLASELMIDWSGQTRQYAAPDLLSALRGRLRRWLLKEKAARHALGQHEFGEESAREASLLLTRLESLQGGPFERLSRITYARVFEGKTLRDVARDDCSSPATLQRELQRFAVRFLI